jgi:3-hydroxyacyl-[acyl-carrier-protein] dehydratase
MNKTNEKRVLEVLPQLPPFRFVDEITHVTDDEIHGRYTFKKNEFYYEGHFKGNPVTPGVILTECLVQIVLSCHSAHFFLKDDPEVKKKYTQFLTSTEVKFYKAVYPGDTVYVLGKKEYFRHGKIKSTAVMTGSKNEVICRGVLSGLAFVNE